MKYRELGDTGIRVSTIALGTWSAGGGPWWGETDAEEAVRAIQASLDAGVNLIDTAPMYGFGRAEELIARAIRGRRDRVVLATKCGLWWRDERGSPWFEHQGRTIRRSLRPDTIRLELEDSLRRLRVDCIDLYQTHWPSMPPDLTPIAETMACLLELRDQGKIRAIGVSNVTPAQIEEYLAVGPVAACQPRYSLLDRRIERDLLPYCRAHNIATLVYSPLEQGLLTGRIGMDRTFAPGEYRNMIPWFRPANRRRVLELLEGWRDLCEAHRCTMGQLVLACTVAQPGITSALVGARKVAHAEENAAAGDIELTDAELARMRRDVELLGEPVE
ncbi:MAG: aldo/keto reductase [Kiritimatiellae bacterium]|nr:aldo/keto reductase [Kiritimatiellia bacterium]